jgi:hypothetical protein
MGKARKSLQDKDKKEKALYYANSVTFDLIGESSGLLKYVICLNDSVPVSYAYFKF